MPCLSHHQRGDILTDLTCHQQPVDFGQLEPQRASDPEPTGSFKPRDVAGQAQLVGYPATYLLRMDISGQLCFRLGLGKPDRFGYLQRSSRRLDPLQPGNPINPGSIRCLACISRTRTLSDTLSQASQHIIQPTSQPIDHLIHSRLRNHTDCHASNTTDQHRHFSLTHSKHLADVRRRGPLLVTVGA